MAGEREVRDFAEFVTGDDAPILVGGQAVNLWCLLSPEMLPETEQLLEQFKPFTSRDCDVLGTRELLYKLKAKTNLEIRDYKLQPSPCLGYLYDKDDPETPVIEVLHRINGLSADEVGDGQPVHWEDRDFRTINPLKLLKAKIANVNDIPQEGRQDLRHVQMLIICVRAYIAYAHQRACDSGNVDDLKLLKQLLNNYIELMKSETGRRIVVQNGIELKAAIPVQILRESPLEPVQKFCRFQLHD